MKKPKAYIGISGWKYSTWRDDFYPKGLIQRKELAYVAGKLNTVEINGSFYSLQRASSFQKWAAETPENFLFAVKGGRYISHMLKLKNTTNAMSNFYGSGVLALEDKLGPILWQLPEHLHYDRNRIEHFLEALPRTTLEASELAANNEDNRLKEPTWIHVEKDRPFRYALEVRHPSYQTEEFYSLCRKHNVAVVIADTANRWPHIEEDTADFQYMRLHGEKELYVTGYEEDSLQEWASKVTKWQDQGKDVYVYFDNDVLGRAPHDAVRLSEILKE